MMRAYVLAEKQATLDAARFSNIAGTLWRWIR
jgi:hypothetical protein